MKRRNCLAAMAAVLALVFLMTGCVPDGLPPGDRDEIGQGAVEEVVETGTESGTGAGSETGLGSRHEISVTPELSISGLEPYAMPCFLEPGSGAGPGGGGLVEMTDIFFTDSDGRVWAACDALNVLLGFGLIREDNGEFYVRYDKQDRSSFRWDKDGARLVLDMDVLSEYCVTSGLEDEVMPEIVLGDAVSDKDRPVLDSVLAAMGSQEESRAVVFDFTMRPKYRYKDVDYVPDGSGPVALDMIPQDPDGLVFDGRRVWYDSKDTLLIESDAGDAVRYRPE